MWKRREFVALAGLLLVAGCQDGPDSITSSDLEEEGLRKADAALFAFAEAIVVDANNFRLTVTAGSFPADEAGFFKNTPVLFGGGLAYAATANQLILGFS